MPTDPSPVPFTDIASWDVRGERFGLHDALGDVQSGRTLVVTCWWTPERPGFNSGYFRGFIHFTFWKRPKSASFE